MAATTVKSGLVKKLGTKVDEAMREEASKPIRTGFKKLPGGITNGRAKLSEIGFKQYGDETTAKLLNGMSAKGEYYFYAKGVVCYPEYVATKDGQEYILNEETGIMIGLYDTKNQKGDSKSAAQHMCDVVNEIKKLAETTDPNYADDINLENVEQKAADLLTIREGPDGKPCGPYFKFTTSFGKPKKGLDGKPVEGPLPVFENWHGSKGIPDDYDPNIEADGQTDETGGKEEVKKLASNGATTQSRAPKTQIATKTPSGNGIAFSEFGDLDALAKKAKSGADAKASRLKLQEFAKEAGVEEEEVSGAKDWDEVASLIKSKMPGGENGKSDEGEEIELFVPVKGKTCTYFPHDKNDEPTGEEILCDVLKVNEKLEWANLKSLEDGETLYKEVDWKQLGPAS